MNLKNKMVTALRQDCHAKMQLAECNILTYLENPAGVGDHPNIVETIQGQLDIISQNQDRLNVLDKLQ